ncbi:DUF4435 domain-containing protein [Xylanibacter muris]|uniref:DUF4435 domain-containing protein n=1 Tax=Xylanibacter muris TaxID=2736290 RepID=A0ABX2ALU1_9BACT|nr:DUF4435 domain-containing protein [Xylanibacter muris]NPD91562.1 DUF4435 domain-containing protein [Xylanibacter muris]
MGRRLRDNISSQYVEAANRLRSKKARRKIVAYVESYEDIFFWRTVLGRFEDSTRYFEVMLPSHGKLKRGKKSVLMNLVGNMVGENILACVDADYDYMLQGKTEGSSQILNNPYVLHTYVYAIENYQCYAPGLHNVAVMVTLNDHDIFDFGEYLALYSEAFFPLFVWSVWMYRTGYHGSFSISDFCHVIDPGSFSIDNPYVSIQNVRRKVNRRIAQLKSAFPLAKESYLSLKAEILSLGVKPETAYLYIQGHHLFDVVVVPIMNKVCSRLRQERENEIHRTATHNTQMRNELSCYEKSIEDIRSMLKRNTGYTDAPEFKKLLEDVGRAIGDVKAHTGETRE